MSYILDALKKAEADRDPDTRANLAIEQQERRRHRRLMYLAIAALLGNAVILLWLFFPDDVTLSPEPFVTPAANNTVPQAQQQVREDSQSTGEPTAQVETPPAAANQQSELRTQASPERIEPPATPTAIAAVNPILQRITVAALPASARSRFPALSFSTHIYADDPGLRAIVVNGTRLLEGDGLAGLTVAEITEDGAVFAFESYLVSVPVLEGWN